MYYFYKFNCEYEILERFIFKSSFKFNLKLHKKYCDKYIIIYYFKNNSINIKVELIKKDLDNIVMIISSNRNLNDFFINKKKSRLISKFYYSIKDAVLFHHDV